MSESPTAMQNFITIHSGVFDPRIGEIVFTRIFFLFFSFVFRYFRQAIAETVAPILTLNTSNGVVPRKDVPFGGPGNISPHLGVKSRKPPQKGCE